MSYKLGKLDGDWRQWYEDGKLAVQGSYRDGEPQGSWLHHVYEDKNKNPEVKNSSMRYWKFVVNAAVRYGEILDEINSGIAELHFDGGHIKKLRNPQKHRKVFIGSVTINKKKFKNSEYVFQGKQLITYYPESKKPEEGYKNKLDGLVHYLMYSGRNIEKTRMASFYHECYKKNEFITAGELIERDLTDQAIQQWKKEKKALTASIKNEIITEIRNEVLSDFEQTNTSDTREVVDEIKSKIENVEIEKKLQKEEKYKVEESGKDSVKIVVSDILISVDSIQYNGYQEGIGNLCTRLTFESGIHKYMKLSTWDQSGEVTEKAKTLIDKNVTTTCWDPLGTTKWSDMGYFKNIYEV
jgi:hypothetical protein